ncbi:Heterogeneous nuclear ribonucleoprotein Q [Trifolium medium]|uniref:Heterogeneous nuclear ribonucleoprotein Q n=1 Tax=Trifolium medium TaxID=97028 RepID=A0A392PNB3_9FABA|nr:Heterogeneous nuclear ribonucleoprotein Q [Trifolium medium]
MPPKVVKRGAAAKKAKLSSKTTIQNQQQEPEPVKNHVADVVGEENPVETNNLAQEIVPNGLDVVENFE